MNELELIAAARVVIEQEKNWSKGRYARNKEAWPVSPCSDEAFCFCSTGALRRAFFVITGIKFTEAYLAESVQDKEFDVIENAFDILSSFVPTEPKNIIVYNDHKNTAHSDVLKVFDLAIEAGR
jgi:hypothetical protein